MWFGKCCSRQTQVSRSTLNQIKEKKILALWRILLSTINTLECLRFCLFVLLSWILALSTLFLCVYLLMVEESVRTLGMCPSQERSVTIQYLCWKELVHRNDLSSSLISSPAANQSTEVVDLISWNLNCFFLALFLPLGGQWMVLFSPQSAQGWVLSTSWSLP